jgi:hypothetical protein
MKWLILPALLLIVCDDASDHKRTIADNQEYFCHYYKDKRTDVCFVGNAPKHLDHDHSHLSVVPCTDHIEEIIEPWPVPENQ